MNAAARTASGASRLAGRRALLIGAATGIGRAIAQRFAEEGAAIVIADLNEEGGAESARLCTAAGGEASFLPVDVRSDASVRNATEQAVRRLDGLDVLVNIAGVMRVGAIETITDPEWSLVFDTNVRSQFLSVRHALPTLKASGRGSIINMASAAGFKGGPGLTLYAASKGACIAYSRTLAAELGPSGIRVNAVCPGFVDTPFNDPATNYMGGRKAVDEHVGRAIPLKRQATAEEIAPCVAFLASDEASYMTGQALLIDGGML